jgi:hypothetical protein
MATASSPQVSDDSQPLNLELLDHVPESVTLLELVYAISAICNDDEIVVDTAISMLAVGRVELRGNFRGTPVENFKA